MDQLDLINCTRVRLAALGQVARGGGQVTAYDLARAIQPMLDLALGIGIEAGRWQASRAAAIAARAAADADARARYGPGADAPGDDAPGASSRAGKARDRVARKL